MYISQKNARHTKESNEAKSNEKTNTFAQLKKDKYNTLILTLSFKCFININKLDYELKNTTQLYATIKE